MTDSRTQSLVVLFGLTLVVFVASCKTYIPRPEPEHSKCFGFTGEIYSEGSKFNVEAGSLAILQGQKGIPSPLVRVTDQSGAWVAWVFYERRSVAFAYCEDPNAKPEILATVKLGIGSGTTHRLENTFNTTDFTDRVHFYSEALDALSELRTELDKSLICFACSGYGGLDIGHMY